MHEYLFFYRLKHELIILICNLIILKFKILTERYDENTRIEWNEHKISFIQFVNGEFEAFCIAYL